MTAAPLALALISLGSGSPAEPQTLSSHVLLATVSAGNRALLDLGVDDFVVEEGGVAREVFDVHVADYPVVVLLDNGADATSEVAAIRDAAARFVSRIGERAVAVGTVTSPPSMLATFDDGRATVLDRLQAAPVNPSTTREPLEAIANAVRLIQQVGTPFSAVVVISARPVDPTALRSSDLLTPILDSHAVVHVVAHRPAAAGLGATPLGDTDVLRQLADVTRGQFTTIYSAASYPIALDRLADRLATEMMIEYLVPAGAKAGGEVRVGVRIPGARVIGLGISR